MLAWPSQRILSPADDQLLISLRLIGSAIPQVGPRSRRMRSRTSGAARGGRGWLGFRRSRPPARRAALGARMCFVYRKAAPKCFQDDQRSERFPRGRTIRQF
jgi:hypothetical protein